MHIRNANWKIEPVGGELQKSIPSQPLAIELELLVYHIRIVYELSYYYHY